MYTSWLLKRLFIMHDTPKTRQCHVYNSFGTIMQCHNYNNSACACHEGTLACDKQARLVIDYLYSLVSPQTTPTFPISVTFNIATLQLFSWH